MRILSILLPVAMVTGAPAAAQSFQPGISPKSLTPLEALWHVRAALNVAALGCRDADEARTVASYNTLIRHQQDAFAAANDAVSTHYKVQYGARWETVREHDMTKLYNFFAQPAAAREFCETAKAALADISTVDSGDLTRFAVAVLPELEAPFRNPRRDLAPQYADEQGSAIVAISARVSVVARANMHR